MDLTRTATWLGALQALLPPGQAITREPDANVTKLLEAWAAMMGDAELSFDEWFAQYDPNLAVQMLEDWERFLGLPDICDIGIAQTLQERRAAVVERLYVMGGNSRQYFIDMYARRGIPITIDELAPHFWRVNAPMVNLRHFRAGAGRCGDRLRTWGNPPMECRIQRLKPAHTRVVFGYA